MSTWWYLECTEHDPPLRSFDEVGQHNTDLPAARIRVAELRAKSDAELHELARFAPRSGTGWFDGNIVRFIADHPRCHIEFVSEYGMTENL